MEKKRMKKGILIISLFLLFVTGVVIVGEAQQDKVEENFYKNDDHMLEYFMKGVIIMDTFNPVRRASYYKCEMGKTYPYSLS